MRVAFLILTNECNRRCPYCFYETGYQQRKDASQVLDVNADLLDALIDAGVRSLIISGGEPLILSSLEDTVASAAQKGFYVLLLSNGDLMTPDRFDALAESGLSALTIVLSKLSLNICLRFCFSSAQKKACLQG